MNIEFFNNFVAYVETLDKFYAFFVLVIAKVVAGGTLLPGTPLTLLSGVVLGKFWGTVAAVLGNFLGAIVAFLWARYLFKDYVQKKILAKYPKINEYENSLFKDGFWTVIFLRLVPLFPFNILNPVLGVTEVKLRDYMLGTFFGLIPGTFLFVYLGESFKMFSFLNMALALLGILGLSYLGKIWTLKK